MKSLGQECAATNVKSSGEKVEKLSTGASFFLQYPSQNLAKIQNVCLNIYLTNDSKKLNLGQHSVTHQEYSFALREWHYKKGIA